ncbi:hypothetical protein [Cellulomonas sp. PhB150]|uniref:hypothetical protein n=1 Tax=Cellulomonas sp. PhB150 TaxID=2485188 RepID=UPI000F46327C|nr:hypothetical protein [Cellulomonas sp. PhB150]ROS23695.1 hypothetical protein EDF34_2755 [Cellulomonas sp. PhB150]
MSTFVTALAALLIVSPLVVLALRGTRWDPIARTADRPAECDADARRAALDLAALRAHEVPEPVVATPTSPAGHGRALARMAGATPHAS